MLRYITEGRILLPHKITISIPQNYNILKIETFLPHFDCSNHGRNFQRSNDSNSKFKLHPEFSTSIWGMKITVIGNDTSRGERSNRIQMTHETVFLLLGWNNQLLPRGCSRVESVCTGWKGRVVREGAIRGRCSVLAKLKTGWKLMGVRTVVAKYLHAGPGISIKVNPPSFEQEASSSSRILSLRSGKRNFLRG